MAVTGAPELLIVMGAAATPDQVDDVVARLEEAVPLERLGEASEVFLTGAVRGIEPVRGWDGVLTGSEQLVTPLLSHALRRHWRSAHDR